MRIHVRVKPNSRSERVERTAPETYLVSVHASAQEGKANEAVIRVLARFFGVPRSSVTILHGLRARKKLVQIGEG